MATSVSNLGWVDAGSLWTFDIRSAREATLPLGAAKYLTLRGGTDGYVAAVHHYDGPRVEITVHRFARLREPVARATIEPSGSTLSGDAGAWAHVPAHYTAFYRGAAWTDYALIRIDARAGCVELQRFEWFDDRYDKDYQGIIGITEVPGTRLVLVSVQRSSTLVIHDPVSGEQAGEIVLGRGSGNPSLYFRHTADELWAMDYDTIVKVEPGSWRVRASRRIQEPSLSVGQFAGSFWFTDDEKICIVARPFSADVVAIEPDSVKTVATCPTGQQPLEAIATPDGRVVARDWKTGSLLRGDLQHE
jgi:hypothetical protein